MRTADLLLGGHSRYISLQTLSLSLYNTLTAFYRQDYGEEEGYGEEDAAENDEAVVEDAPKETEAAKQ